MGLGIGIVAYMAYDPAADKEPARGGCRAPLRVGTTRIGIRRNAWLRGYVYTFIELFAPHLTRKMVQAALAGEEGSDPGL
jgi:LysR family cys regulon transcriptional activator